MEYFEWSNFFCIGRGQTVMWYSIFSEQYPKDWGNDVIFGDTFVAVVLENCVSESDASKPCNKFKKLLFVYDMD